MKIIIIFQLSFLLALLLGYSCTIYPSCSITDKYIEVSRPGNTFGLVEVAPVTFDSLLGYPLKETEVLSYSLIDRDSRESVGPNSLFKVFFNIRNKKYCWLIQENKNNAVDRYVDTIQIKKNTWYRLTTEKSESYTYFYWRGDEGNYVIRLKPKSGAY